MGTLLNRPSYVRQGPLVAIYGPPGFGKTSLIAGLAKEMHERGKGPVLHADWELSTESLVHLPYPEESLKVWMPDLQKIPADEAIESVDVALKIGASALVVDTVGAFLAAILRWLTTQSYAAKSGRVTARPGVRTARGLQIVSATQQDYGMAATAFLSWLEYALRLRNRGIPIVLLGHEKLLTAEDMSGQTIDAKGGPELVGRALVRDFPKIAQIVAHGVFIRRPGRSPLRVLQMEEDGVWMGKDRLNLWPNKKYDFTAESDKDIVERAAGFWKPVVDRLFEKMEENEEKTEKREKKIVKRRRKVNG